MKKKVNKKEFIDNLTAYRTDYDSGTFKQDVKDLDTLLQQEREKCDKENKQLIKWLSNLTSKIMRYDDFKGLRGYPLKNFIEQYKPYLPPNQ